MRRCIRACGNSGGRDPICPYLHARCLLHLDGGLVQACLEAGRGHAGAHWLDRGHHLGRHCRGHQAGIRRSGCSPAGLHEPPCAARFVACSWLRPGAGHRHAAAGLPAPAVVWCRPRLPADTQPAGHVQMRRVWDVMAGVGLVALGPREQPATQCGRPVPAGRLAAGPPSPRQALLRLLLRRPSTGPSPAQRSLEQGAPQRPPVPQGRALAQALGGPRWWGADSGRSGPR